MTKPLKPHITSAVPHSIILLFLLSSFIFLFPFLYFPPFFLFLLLVFISFLIFPFSSLIRPFPRPFPRLVFSIYEMESAIFSANFHLRPFPFHQSSSAVSFPKEGPSGGSVRWVCPVRPLGPSDRLGSTFVEVRKKLM